MSETAVSYEQSEHRSSEPQKIDIMHWVDRFLHSLRKLWWLVILLAVGFGAYNYFHVNQYYIPNYQAEATLTISATTEGQKLSSDNYTNVATTQELVDVYSSIVESGILNDRIAEYMGLDYVPGSYNVSCVENTNMLVVTANASDGQTAYDLLQAVIVVYPDVAQFVVGQTTAVILDDSGVPTDTGMEYRTRGSLKAGAFRGLIFGLIILLIDMLLQRTIRYQSDFASMLHVRCLGTLPEIKEKKRRKGKSREISILNNSATDSYLEATRYLRSRVERQLDKEKEKTFLITSSVPSEGKSTVAVNLAVSFARKGKSVILIDCDLRHPSVQEKLSIEGDFPGLAKVLHGEATMEQSLYKVPGMELRILCGMKESSERIEILGQEAMRQLIHRAEQSADIVILDTSPSAMLADAITLAKNVKMALYVVRCDYAKIRNILDGIDELQETGIKLMGCVLNYGHSRAGRSYGYGYGYGYGKYGKYGYGKYGYGSSRSDKKDTSADNSKEQTAKEDKVPKTAAPADFLKSLPKDSISQKADNASAVKDKSAVKGTSAALAASADRQNMTDTQPADTQNLGIDMTGSGKISEQERKAILDEITAYEEKIVLTQRYMELRRIYNESRNVPENEREDFYRSHETEIREYNAVVAGLKERFPDLKIPSVNSMKKTQEALRKLL